MDQNNKNNPKGNQPKNQQSLLLVLVCVLVSLLCMSFFSSLMNKTTSSEITYNKFIRMVENNEVESVTISDIKLTILKKEQISMYIEKTYYKKMKEDKKIKK